MDTELFEAFKKLDISKYDVIDVRLIKKILLGFERSGVNKSDVARLRIKEINEKLTTISQEFGRIIRDDVRSVPIAHAADLEGLPADFITAKLQTGFVTTEYTDFYPVMLYAKNAYLREELYRAFQNRGYPKNESVLESMLSLRFELAKLLGYAHWADYVTEEKMIKTGAAISDFIEKISELTAHKSKKEYTALLERKQKDFPEARVVEPWEKAYFEECLKREQFNFDSQSVRNYFEFTQVKNGLLELTATLFGVVYEPVPHADVWHSSVEVLDVHRKGTHIGRIFLDLHPREHKYKHAAQFTLQSGVAGVQLPHGVLVCNFSDPAIANPALMDHSQVTTFFHEFGHLIHHILGGNQKWLQFSGVATEWDFVETPSQLFEEWAWNEEVLRRFAVHHESGEPIPTDLVRAMRTAEEFGKGLFAQRQLFYAALSVSLYNQNPSEMNVHAHVAALYKKFQPFPYYADLHTELSFGHLDGYSAIYYTYLWSLVIAKDLIQKFKESNLLDTKIMQEYARLILEPGGSSDAADLVTSFLGRPYSFDAFATWLET